MPPPTPATLGGFGWTMPTEGPACRRPSVQEKRMFVSLGQMTVTVSMPKHQPYPGLGQQVTQNQ